MKTLKLLALSSAFSLGVMAAPASAAELVVDGDWEIFSWSGGAGAAWDTDFTFDLLGSGELQIVDCCVSGDRFEVFINGTSQGLTSDVPSGISTGLVTGDAAWASTSLSKGSYLLGPGSYTVTGITAITAPGFSSGGGFARVLSVGGAVPEPATWAMMLLGFFGIGGAMRARKTRQRVTVSYA